MGVGGLAVRQALQRDLVIASILPAITAMWGCSSFEKSDTHELAIYLFIYYLFMAVLGLRFCARAFSSCSKRGPLFIAVRGPLTVAASPAAEHRLQMHRLSSCGSRAQSLRGMWDPPRPGLQPVSPALAGRPSTIAPPGKPPMSYFNPFIRLRQGCKVLVWFSIPMYFSSH